MAASNADRRPAQATVAQHPKCLRAVCHGFAQDRGTPLTPTVPGVVQTGVGLDPSVAALLGKRLAAAGYTASAMRGLHGVPAFSWFSVAIDAASTAHRRRHPLPDNHPVIPPDDASLLFDFRDPAAVNGWTAIDDRVMGGISRSRLRHDPAGHAVFEGEVSLERNGGFASVRSSPGARGTPGAKACLIEVRGGGRQFKLSLLTDDGFDSLSYQCGFASDSDDWQTIRLALRTFHASFRGRDVPGAPALDPARIRQVGLMIAARQAGPFALEMRRISLA